MTTPFEALTGVVNACQILPGVVTGGQPTAPDLERFRAAGGGIVLDLRDPMEPRPLDEPALAGKLGLKYVNVPVGSGSLNDQTIERVLGVLRNAGDTLRLRPLRQRQPGGRRLDSVSHAGPRAERRGRGGPGDASRLAERGADGVGSGVRQTEKLKALGTEAPRAFSVTTAAAYLPHCFRRDCHRRPLHRLRFSAHRHHHLRRLH